MTTIRAVLLKVQPLHACMHGYTHTHTHTHTHTNTALWAWDPGPSRLAVMWPQGSAGPRLVDVGFQNIPSAGGLIKAMCGFS